jgi:hypothetical protein
VFTVNSEALTQSALSLGRITRSLLFNSQCRLDSCYHYEKFEHTTKKKKLGILHTFCAVYSKDSMKKYNSDRRTQIML